MPVGLGSVVDGGIGAEGAGLLQLFIAAGGHDDAGARQFGELQRKHRHTAGAQGQDRLAGQQAAGGEGVPRGEAGEVRVAASA